MTVSEYLFERFCKENGIKCFPIPRSKDGAKTPDYEVIIDDKKVVVEVKQFDPNPDDKEHQKQLEKNGMTEVYQGNMTRRIRGKINDAMPQLKNWAKQEIPSLLFLYSNVPLDAKTIYSHNVLEAMYGGESSLIIFPRNPNVFPYVKNTRFGGDRKVAPKYNTSLSAIVTLREDWKDRKLYANFFHNVFSKYPFNPDWLRREGINHFTLPNIEMKRFSEWIKV